MKDNRGRATCIILPFKASNLFCDFQVVRQVFPDKRGNWMPAGVRRCSHNFG